jgi:hypothetical protein
VRTEPITIGGLAGPVVVDVNTFTGKHSVTVGGRPAEGGRRGEYQLPAAGGGAVPARLKASFLEPYPTIEIEGVKHRTGPQLPMVLRLLSLVPVGLVAFGLVGGLCAGLGIVSNLAIARTKLPTAVRAAAMLSVFIVGLVVVLLVAAAVNRKG